MLSSSEKKHVIKAFTSLTKKMKHKGPDNIYIKYDEDKMEIVMQGFLTNLERHFIEAFGDEAKETFDSFYKRDSVYMEEKFNDLLEIPYKLTLDDLMIDFDADLFVYSFFIKF